MYKRQGYIFLFLLFFSPQLSEAQERFTASLIGGFTASQIDHDQIYGFNYLGLWGGARVETNLKENLGLLLDLLYVQKGSNGTVLANGRDIRISIHSLDIPVGIVYKDWKNNEVPDPYHRIHFEGGLSYSRIININSYGILSDSEDFNDIASKNLLEGFLGASFYLNSHWGINFRYQHAFNALVPFDKTINQSFNGLKLQLYYLKTGILYTF